MDEEFVIEIEFRVVKPAGDRARRKATRLRLVGTADAYGEIEVWLGPGVATVTGAGVPSAEIRHPGTPTTHIMPIDGQTVLTVDGAGCLDARIRDE